MTFLQRLLSLGCRHLYTMRDTVNGRKVWRCTACGLVRERVTTEPRVRPVN